MKLCIPPLSLSLSRSLALIRATVKRHRAPRPHVQFLCQKNAVRKNNKKTAHILIELAGTPKAHFNLAFQTRKLINRAELSFC